MSGKRETGRRQSRREDDVFYAAVLSLRRAGFRVTRVDPEHCRVKGRYCPNVELIQYARWQSRRQLDLFRVELKEGK